MQEGSEEVFGNIASFFVRLFRISPHLYLGTQVNMLIKHSWVNI